MTPPGAENKPATLGTALREKSAGGGAVLLSRRGLEVPADLEARLAGLLERLASETGAPIVLTALSNAELDLNPFAGLECEAGAVPDGKLCNDLVALLSPGRVHEWNLWPGHLALVSAAAIDVLALPDTTPANAVARLEAAGGRILLSDGLFLHDADSPLFE